MIGDEGPWAYGYEYDEERDRGVLSKADRRFLADAGEGRSVGSARNIRQRIRERLTNAIIDFDILSRCLSDRDLEMVFEDAGDYTDVAFDAGMKSMVELLYRGVPMGERDGIDFDTVLRSGIHDAETRDADGPVRVDVDLSVDVEPAAELDPDALLRRYRSGQQLTVTEIGTMLALGVIDPDDDELADFARYARENATVEITRSPMIDEQIKRHLGYWPDETDAELPLKDLDLVRYMAKFKSRSEFMPMLAVESRGRDMSRFPELPDTRPWPDDPSEIIDADGNSSSDESDDETDDDDEIADGGRDDGPTTPP